MLWSVLCEKVQVQSVFIVFFFRESRDERVVISKWFCPAAICPFFSRGAAVWVCAGSRTLGENVKPSTCQLCTADRLLCLLYTTYVGKSDQASQLSQLSQRL